MPEPKYCECKLVYPGVYACPDCDRPVVSSAPPQKRRCGPAEPKPPKVQAATAASRELSAFDVPCVHRGKLLREEGCKPCQANGYSGLVQVYACPKHGECTLRNTGIHPKIHGCITCTDRVEPPRRRRIAFLTPSLMPGGAERWLVSLARYTSLNPVGCVVTTPSMIDDQMAIEMGRHCKVLNLDGGQAALKAADVILTWGIGNLRAIISPTVKSPIVYAVQGACQWTADRLKEARGVPTHWAGVSEFCRRVFPSDLAPKMQVIYNGAEIDRATPARGRIATRTAWGVSPERKLVGYIGRICPAKRPEAVIEAVAELPRDWHGVICGRGFDDGYVGTIKTLANQLAPGRIIFTGHLPYVGDALAAIDVGINASPSEGFSLSLIDAWLASVPFVSTPTGSIDELQNRFGKLVEQVPIGATGKELATAVQVAANIHNCSVTAHARRVAWDNFTAPAMAARWDNLLLSIAR